MLLSPATHTIEPFERELPAPLFFRWAKMPPRAVCPWHKHMGGEFIYSYSGVVEVTLEGGKYLSPPHYGVWLAPYAAHTSRTHYGAEHCSLYVAPDLCGVMPDETCALVLSPLILALLEHLRAHSPSLPMAPEDRRLLDVLLHQLSLAPATDSYLPASDDPLLGAVLEALESNPADNRTLAELAAAANSTERTLARRCQSELGISFAEWRQRLRVVRALAMLEKGWSVEAIALELGYSSSSAFIAMFKRLMRMTPGEFRRQGG